MSSEISSEEVANNYALTVPPLEWAPAHRYWASTATPPITHLFRLFYLPKRNLHLKKKVFFLRKLTLLTHSVL